MINLATSAFYQRANRQIGGLRDQASALQQQIATGNRLSRPSDDPVAAARLRTLARSERLSATAQRGSDSARTDLMLSDSALNAAANIVIRARELTALAASGTVNDQQRKAIAIEITGLRDSLLATANSTNAGGHALFGGATRGAAYVENAGVVTYAGTAGANPVDLGDGQAVTPTVSGPHVFDITINGATTNLFAVLGSLATELTGGGDPAASAVAAIGGLDAALEKVTTAQTVIGARLAWVETMDQRREAMGERNADEQASVGGTDIATAVVRLQGISTVLEASQASFVRLANLSLFQLLR